MNINSNKISLVVLAITAIACSRALFAFFNDPEGPNLLVVLGTAAIVYLVSLAGYFYFPLAKQGGLKKLLVPILIQIVVVAGLGFLL